MVPVEVDRGVHPWCLYMMPVGLDGGVHPWCM